MKPHVGRGIGGERLNLPSHVVPAQITDTKETAACMGNEAHSVQEVGLLELSDPAGDTVHGDHLLVVDPIAFELPPPGEFKLDVTRCRGSWDIGKVPGEELEESRVLKPSLV